MAAAAEPEAEPEAAPEPWPRCCFCLHPIWPVQNYAEHVDSRGNRFLLHETRSYFGHNCYILYVELLEIQEVRREMMPVAARRLRNEMLYARFRTAHPMGVNGRGNRPY